MNKDDQLKHFRDALRKILKADPKIVKAAMEQERQERAEERKAGVKIRGRRPKTALVVFVPLLMLVTAHAADKHPERKARDRYAQQFAAEIEHDGWSVTTFAMRPGCPSLCINHGEHDCLRIFLNGGTVEAVDRLAAQELKPRIADMRSLGFVEIDILGLQLSHSYPDGMARIPFPPEGQQ